MLDNIFELLKELAKYRSVGNSVFRPASGRPEPNAEVK